MYAYDFEFNGKSLSDYGFIICDIGGDTGTENVSAGGTVTIKTVRHGIGRRYVAVGATYERCIEADFTICKDPCIYKEQEISEDELRDLMRWLNRRAFYKMRFFKEPQNDDNGCYYNAAFQISKVCLNGATVGLALHMTTDSPFGHGDKVTLTGDVVTSSDNRLETLIKHEDTNDDIGYIFPDMTLFVFSMDDGNNGEMTKITVTNNMYPDEAFEINEDDFTGVLAKKYTVDGTAMTIRESIYEADLAAYDSNDDVLGDVSEIKILDNYLSKSIIYTLTGGLETGEYRFVVGGTQDEKKFIMEKLKEDGTPEIIKDDMSYIYSTFMHVGYIGSSMIQFRSDNPLDIGSYITMTVSKEDAVVGDAFNYNFVKIGNTQDDKTNHIRCNLPCIMKIYYEPIINLTP